MDESHENLERTSTSTFTGATTAQTVNLSSITYNDSSGVEKLTIKGGTTFEVRDKTSILLFNVNANAHSGFNMHRHLLMSNDDIAGGRKIGANNDINAINGLNGNNMLTCKNSRDNINLNFYR